MRLRAAPGGLAAAVFLALLPAAAAAQQNCVWQEGTGQLTGRTQGTARVFNVVSPRLACDGGIRVRADSAVQFEASGFYQLFGNVFFQNPERSLSARDAQYFSRSRQLQAQGNVVVRDRTDGSELRGENLLYRQSGPGQPRDQLTMSGGRPHATLYADASADSARGPTLPAPDTAAAPGARVPYEVDADRIYLEGRADFRAYGRVVIEREGMLAYGDTVTYSESRGVLDLRRGARIVQPPDSADADGEGAGDPTELRGHRVRVELPGQRIEGMTAEGEAELLADDLRLAAHRIVLFATDGAMDRVVATPERRRAPDPGVLPDIVPPPGEPPPPPVRPGERPDAGAQEGEPGYASRDADLMARHPTRPVGRAADFAVIADSIDVRAPGEVLERLVAVGHAYGESTARDSLNTPDTPPVARKDWIDGDTVVAVFAPPADPPADAEGAPGGASAPRRAVLERIEARVDARTLYRVAATDSSAAPASAAADSTATAPGGPRAGPAIHYVTGSEIVILLRDGAVEEMTVVGPTRGLHQEPVGRRRTAPPDTAASGVRNAATRGADARDGGRRR